MDLNKFKTDPDLDEGAWIELGDAKIKIARIGTPKYQSALAARLKPHRQAIQLDAMSEEQAIKIETELLADFIVLGWEGVEDEGKPLPYSRENVIKALGVPLFRQWVKEQATNLENFRAKDLREGAAAVAKN